jgi:hypothetical protein
MKKLKLVSITLFLAVTSVMAQKVVVESGAVPSLKGETKLNLVYDYSEMEMGKYGSEADYTKKKVEDLNKKTPGKGDKWLEGWNGNKENRYHPKFEELINKGLGKTGCAAGQNYKDAKYTLRVKTITLFPGWNIGVSKLPAYCTFRFELVESAAPDKVIAALRLTNVQGSQAMGYDFDEGSRVAESYAKAGKIMAKYLGKSFK